METPTHVEPFAQPEYKTGADAEFRFGNDHPDPDYRGQPLDVAHYNLVDGTSPGHVFNYRRTRFDDTVRGAEVVELQLLVNVDRFLTVRKAYPANQSVGTIRIRFRDQTGHTLVEGYVAKVTENYPYKGGLYAQLVITFRRKAERPVVRRSALAAAMAGGTAQDPEPTLTPEEQVAAAASDVPGDRTATATLVTHIMGFHKGEDPALTEYAPALVQALPEAVRQECFPSAPPYRKSSPVTVPYNVRAEDGPGMISPDLYRAIRLDGFAGGLVTLQTNNGGIVYALLVWDLEDSVYRTVAVGPRPVISGRELRLDEDQMQRARQKLFGV